MRFGSRLQNRDYFLALCIGLFVLMLGWPYITNYLAYSEIPEADKALEVHNISRAVRLFDRMLMGRSDRPDLYEEVCKTCALHEQWTLLETYASRGVWACKYAPAHDRAMLYADLSIALGQTEEKHPQDKAIDAADHAVQLEPHNWQFLNTLGYLLADNDIDLPRAEKCLLESLQGLHKDPDTPDKQDSLSIVMDSYGWLLCKQHRNLQAISALAQATSTISEYAGTPSTLKVMYYHLGYAYRQARRASAPGPGGRAAIRSALCSCTGRTREIAFEACHRDPGARFSHSKGL